MTTNDMPTAPAWHEVMSTTSSCYGPSDEYEWAETGDPRVVAIMERQWDAQVSEQLDGDGITPIYYRGWRDRGIRWVAGWDGASEVAEGWDRAFAQGHPFRNRRSWGDTDEEFADRFLRVFYGAHVRHVTGGGDRDGEWMIIDSPAWREHVGSPDDVDPTDLDGIAEELSNILDGDVWGVGYATKMERVTTESDIDILDGTWEKEIICWGHVGEKYAQSEAVMYAAGGVQDLEPLMPGTEVN